MYCANVLNKRLVMNFNHIKLPILLSSVLLLQGCGAGKITVLDPINAEEKAQSIRLKQDTHNVAVEKEKIEYFETQLKEKLYKELGKTEGDDITIKYRFVKFDEGSRFTRYLLVGLGNAGEGSLIIEFTFFNRKGIEIGKVSSEGKISAGFGGGSIDSAIDFAVKAITEYIQKTL